MAFIYKLGGFRIAYMHPGGYINVYMYFVHVNFYCLVNGRIVEILCAAKKSRNLNGTREMKAVMNYARQKEAYCVHQGMTHIVLLSRVVLLLRRLRAFVVRAQKRQSFCHHESSVSSSLYGWIN
jgi:hypothetical protein